MLQRHIKWYTLFVIMKRKATFIKTILIIIIGVILMQAGLDIPKDQVEEVADGLLTEVDKQLSDRTNSSGEGITILQNEEIGNLGKEYKVISVIDGDTLIISRDGQKDTVRVLGINAPETQYSQRGAECFGDEASMYARSLLEHKNVTLIFDPSQDTRDKYGRLLAYVGLSDGRDFGQVMIADGYAYEYTYHGNPGIHQQRYKEAQKIAKKEEVGLWAADVCVE